jgi:RsiG-like
LPEIRIGGVAAQRRLVERLLDPSFLSGLREKSIEDLRAARAECNEGELELSFERRLCQARIDILSAEIEHRRGSEVGNIVDRLPQILATEGSTSDGLPTRARDFSVPRNADVQRRRVEEIVGEQALARLSEVPEEELKTIIQALADHENNLSQRRKRVQEVMDEIQEEIVRRYTSGEADPSQVLR